MPVIQTMPASATQAMESMRVVVPLEREGGKD